MLSKSLGQILRVSVAMHVLFCIGESDEDHDTDCEDTSEVEDNDTDDSSGESGDVDSEAVEVGEKNEDSDEEISNVEGNDGLDSGVINSEDANGSDAASDPLGLSTIVSKKAMTAAIDFVQVCCQHTAHIAGRGNISEELTQIEQGENL